MVKHSGNYMSGFFLNGTDTSDVAVLSIGSFDIKDPDPITEFQDKVATFLALCGSSGKKQLIIDVRGNPGGTAYLAYDIFKRLFPDQVP